MEISNFQQHTGEYAEDYSGNEIGYMTVCDVDGKCLVPAFRCKDFLQEIFFSNTHNIPKGIYGFKWKKPTQDKLYIVYSTNNMDYNLVSNKENITKFLTKYIPDIELHFDDAGYLIAHSNMCYESLSLVSFLALMLRVSISATDDIDDYVNKFKKHLATKRLCYSDTSTMAMICGKSSLEEIFNLPHRKISDLSKTRSTGEIHNDTGINSFMFKMIYKNA